MQVKQILASSCITVSRPCAPVLPRRLVVVHADGPRTTREYREGDDSISVPKPSTSDSQAPGRPLYADEVAAKGLSPLRPKDNLSKEMKQRLKKEYVGLGGAEGKAPLTAQFAFPRHHIVAAGSVMARPVLEDKAAQEAVPLQGRNGAPSSASSEATTSASAIIVNATKSKSKWTIDESEKLSSTWEHRIWTFGPMAIMAATFAHAVSQVETTSDAATFGVAVLIAYVLSDLGTGFYHHGVDNYGGPDTPVFGRQIAAFQGHHQRPWTITQREFSNNLHQVFKPAATPAAALFLLSFFAPVGWNGFASSFLFLVCMSQQFHAWSHMKKSELPGPVIALQEAGVLISRKAHGAHHRAPFEGNYCIVSGLWNPILDDSKFFRGFEQFIFDRTGVAPRCWSEPEDGWEELTQPEAQ